MTILAAMWEQSNCNQAVYPADRSATAKGYSNTTTHFNTNYAREGLQARQSSSEYVLDLKADYSDIWLHFDVFTVNNATTTARGWIEMYNSAGVMQFRTAYGGTATHSILQRSTNGGVTFTNVDGSDTFIMSVSTRHTLDIHIKAHATEGEASVYVNAALSNVDVSGDVSSQDNAIRYIVLKSDSAGNTLVYSQVIAATTSTIGWRLQTLLPTANGGGVAQWDGSYTSVAATGFVNLHEQSLSTNVPNEAHSFPTTNVTGDASSLIVQGIMVSARGFITAGSTVDDIRGLLRMGGVNYESPDLGFISAPNGGEQTLQYLWDLNPVTMNAFSQSDINNLEIGVVSV